MKFLKQSHRKSLVLMLITCSAFAVFCKDDTAEDPHRGHVMASGASGGTTTSENAVVLAPGRIQEIGIRSEPLVTRDFSRKIRAVGVIRPDERRLAHIHLKFSGYIEDLRVDFVGRSVRRGEILFTIYSPDLFVAQNEYLSILSELRRGEDWRELFVTAEGKLKLLDMGAPEIAKLKKTRKPFHYVPIRSPISGLVLEKKAVKGMSVDPGMELYIIADLNRIWLLAEIYEMEIPLVMIGQKAVLILEDGSEPISGHVTFMDPVLNEKTRTVGVRFEFPNPGMRLKPGMFGTAVIELKSGRGLAVPADAVLDTGRRKVIFLDTGGGRFEPHEVVLGPRSGDYYPVISGIEKGTEARVVTSGQFLLDSESRLQSTSAGPAHAGH